MAQNLQDELGNPRSHLELFDRFASAVGGAPADATTATATLTSTYTELVTESAVAGLAGLTAYETQASAIARTKAEGLRVRYGPCHLGSSSIGMPARPPGERLTDQVGWPL